MTSAFVSHLCLKYENYILAFPTTTPTPVTDKTTRNPLTPSSSGRYTYDDLMYVVLYITIPDIKIIYRYTQTVKYAYWKDMITVR